MDRVLQVQKNALNDFQINIQPAQVMGIFLYFKGTSETGITPTPDDLGEVVIKRQGRTLVNRPVAVFAQMNNIRTGSNLSSYTSGGACVQTCFIPFYAPSMEQAYHITGDSELNFAWQPDSSIDTNFANLTIYGYAVHAELPERYEYTILGDDQTPAAAVTSRPYQLNRENISEVYIRDSGDVLTELALRQDGEQKFTSQPKDVYTAGTLLQNRLEVNDFTMIELQCFTLGQPASVINNNTILELTTSATGTIEVTVNALRFPE